MAISAATVIRCTFACPTAAASRRASVGGVVSQADHDAKRMRRGQIFERGFDFADATRVQALHSRIDTSKEVFAPENRTLITAAMSKVFFSGGEAGGGSGGGGAGGGGSGTGKALEGAAFDRLLALFDEKSVAPGQWLMKEGEVREGTGIVQMCYTARSGVCVGNSSTSALKILHEQNYVPRTTSLQMFQT